MLNNIKNSIRRIGKLKIMSTLLAITMLLTIMLYDVPVNQSWSSWSLPLSGNIFVLDPGHGGLDGGADSDDGTQEKEITLDIAKYLRDYLHEAGALVIMTRDTDTDLASPNTRGLSKRKAEDLQNRVSLANNSLADFYISIHLNSTPSERWHGAQTFYYPVREENEEMAKSIQSSIKGNLKNTDRSPLARNDIIVLKYVEMPSVMVEVGFLSNPTERELLKSDQYQREMAYAIYLGILEYYANIN